MLVGSSTIIRTLQPHHPLYPVADHAIQQLPKRGQKLHIVPQNLVEIWAVATRPITSNGLGMTTDEAAVELARLKSLFTVLPETPDIYPAWESLVVQYRVSGKTTHDTRLVAAMHVHGLSSILAFNAADFLRYSGIQVVHPGDIQPVGQ